jgi:hypothetical protein
MTTEENAAAIARSEAALALHKQAAANVKVNAEKWAAGQTQWIKAVEVTGWGNSLQIKVTWTTAARKAFKANMGWALGTYEVSRSLMTFSNILDGIEGKA